MSISPKYFDPDDVSINLISGCIRDLDREERRKYPGFTLVTTTESRLEIGDELTLTVPVGFLTNGATGAPDYGRAWLFHDWLYATHTFDCGEIANRRTADDIMYIVLRHERLSWYWKLFLFAARTNIFWTFSRAWRNSHSRGPRFIDVEMEEFS